MQEIGGGQRLVRGSDRVLGGVCSGLAQRFAVEPLLVRLAFVLLTLASGTGVVLYALLWVLMPEAGEPPREGDVLRTGLRAVEADLRHLLGVAATVPGEGGERPPIRHAAHGGLALGVLLVGLGALLLASSTGLLGWWNWTVLWPVLVICLGLLLLLRRLS